MAQIPVNYSKLFLNNYYGFMSNPQFNITSNGDKILYNFPIEPNIYQYDIRTKKVNVFGGKPFSKDVVNHTLAEPMKEKDKDNIDKAFSHLVTSIYYFPVLISKDNNYVFRSYHTPKQHIKNASFNDVNKNNKYLMIFDKEFNMISNLNLNDRPYFMFGQFVINDEFYLPCNSDSTSMGFKRFKFIKH